MSTAKEGLRMYRQFVRHAIIWIRSTLLPIILAAIVLGFVLYWFPVVAAMKPAFCTETANSMLMACRANTEDDFWVTVAQCINVLDDAKRQQCETHAVAQKKAGLKQCELQLEARLSVCRLVGEERYQPDFSLANFVDPNEIGKTVPAHPYFPLTPGTRWVYQGGDETITVLITDKIKLIEGVPCRVVTDVVTRGAKLIEGTDDWYAQDVKGNIWYCGELSKTFTTFHRDTPEEPELVDLEGSFKTGRDGARPGILMLARPQVGAAYRQEVALGAAEDVAQVISTTGVEVAPAASCQNDCLVTRDFTPLQPGVDETKYYAPGVGLILEVDKAGNRTELIEFTTR